MFKIYVNDFNPITFLLYQSKSVDWHVIAFCVIITRGKNRVVKIIRLAIGCIPDGSESLTDTFFLGFIILCRPGSLDMRSFVDRLKPEIPTGIVLSVLVIECCVSLSI